MARKYTKVEEYVEEVFRRKAAGETEHVLGDRYYIHSHRARFCVYVCRDGSAWTDGFGLAYWKRHDHIAGYRHHSGCFGKRKGH